MTPPIPNLVFSTRSPSPKSGSDFVREVVAESPGIADEVRTEFARRADIAGSVLQRQLQHAVYMFCRVGRRDAWLLCRAVSLGLYRKGSNQLLVHGLVLAEEHLDALDGNPLLLNLPEVRRESGLAFLDEHPGSGQSLPELSFDSHVAALGRRLNRQRLAQLGELLDDDRFGAAYDALAGLLRVGLITPAPGPTLVEALLLHFHPDDRLELSFHTFYSHSRPLDYRLLLVAPEDSQAVRGQFGDLLLLDPVESPPPAASLGRFAARLRHSPDQYMDTLDQYRLTHWSRRFMEPLAREEEDASLCLRAALGEPTTPAEKRRLRKLQDRGQRGLRSWITSLADVWRDHPHDFPRRLAEMANTEAKVTVREVADLLETPQATDERWCLLALLVQEEGLQPGEDWRSERRRAWRILMPAERFEAFLDGLVPEQTTSAEPILLDYALDSVQPDADGPAQVSSWETLLAWIGRRGSIPKTALARAEAALARLRGDAALDAWSRLQTLLYGTGQPGEALRLFFSRSLPLIPAAEAPQKSKAAIRWWLEHGREHDEEVAPWVGRGDVAEQALAFLGDWFAEQAAGTEAGAFHRVSEILASFDGLPASAGPACGRLITFLARSPVGHRVPEVLDQCLKALSEAEDDEREAFVGAALGGAAGRLIPALEGPDWLRDLHRHIQAVAALLAARNRKKATARADAALLHLAVRGRILAQEARARQLADDAVKALNREWPAFLHGARVLEHLPAPETATSPDTLPRVQEWLELLQDEIAAAPPEHAESDPRFELFVRLAWWRWSAGQGRPGLAAICAKLRLARTWGRIKASVEWLGQRMEEVVPAPLWEQASVLLWSRPEPRRFALWFGGRG